MIVFNDLGVGVEEMGWGGWRVGTFIAIYIYYQRVNLISKWMSGMKLSSMRI